MTYPNDAAIWRDFLADWGAWIPDIFTSAAELDRIADEVPSAWLLATRSANAGIAVRNLWQATADKLPRFSRYLANETARLAIGKGTFGYVLIYFVQAYSEGRDGVFDPGFIFGGVPTSDALISEFVRAHGDVPASLIGLWQMHGFFRTKEASTVASLLPEAAIFAGHPRQLPATLRAPVDDTRGYECLTVVDVDRPGQIAFTRNIGTRAWDDALVCTFTNNDRYSPSPWGGLDSLLTDWSGTDYQG